MNFIQPKSAGDTVMISAFQAREFGLGLGSLLSASVLDTVNENRKDTEYKSREDAYLLKIPTKNKFLRMTHLCVSSMQVAIAMVFGLIVI